MQFSREDPGCDRVATIDIETTHFKPDKGETVSIGLGVHECGMSGEEVSYDLFHRDGEGEYELIRWAIHRLNNYDADLLISYNGRGFDLGFLNDRLDRLGASEISVTLDTPETHLDLFEDRKSEADRRDMKWPDLEECLRAYDLTPATTIWGGSKVTNSVFGEELAPECLQMLENGDRERQSALTDVIDHYLRTDLEANLALFYADIGTEFEPVHLGTTAEFDV